MNEPNLVDDRLNRLERENRKLRRWGVALGVLALAGFAAPLVMSAAPVCKTVWAERYVLKDARGNQRGLWDAYTRNGNPTLQLFDARGKLAMAIALDDEGGPLLSTSVDGKLVRQRLDRAFEPEPEPGGEEPEGQAIVGFGAASR